jgi:DNA-binding transcriptional MerR regulator
MTEVQHSIKVAARRCGLTTHVIRVWEKRYDAVSPDRTDTNRRLYSEEEIERLTLLRVATQAGHSIGNIARLPTKKLRELVAEAIHMPAAPLPKAHAAAADTIDAALGAIRQLSTAQLEEIFERAAVAYGQHGLLEKIIAPLAVKVGDLWQNGVLTAAHEHFASAVIRNFLVRNSKPYALNGSAPTIVIATPAGQLHEIGAVMVAAAANDMGWRMIYLGTSLPAAEIIGAVVQNQARALALSIVFPGDDPLLAGELETLRKQLPVGIKVIAGGRAAGSYRTALQQLGAEIVGELREIYPILERMRVPAT